MTELVELVFPDTLVACCCACRLVKRLTNILELSELAPEPGSGWGCVACQLPPDGAQAALCEDCARTRREPIDVCANYVWAPERVARATLNGRQAHRAKHARALARSQNGHAAKSQPPLVIADGVQLLHAWNKLERRWVEMGMELWDPLDKPSSVENWRRWAEPATITLAEARELIVYINAHPVPSPDGSPVGDRAGYAVTGAIAGAWIERGRT